MQYIHKSYCCNRNVNISGNQGVFLHYNRHLSSQGMPSSILELSILSSVHKEYADLNFSNLRLDELFHPS